MKIAAVQLNAKFADVEYNKSESEFYIKQAATAGAELVVLPEFFTSAIGFNDKMLKVAKSNQNTEKWMVARAQQYNIIIGGSYIFYDGENAYNLFELVFPDGKIYKHKKDIPTQFENCYYTNGDEENILDTPIGKIGVALCWEMIRYDTLRRLNGKADIILAGSCWWDLPEDAPTEREPLRRYNRTLACETPVTFAKLAGVPVIHAAHCGTITSLNFPDRDRLQTRKFVGAAQIISGDGKILAKRDFSEGAGFVTADVNYSKGKEPQKNYPSEYWIPKLPESYTNAWNRINPLGKQYYQAVARPFYKESFEK